MTSGTPRGIDFAPAGGEAIDFGRSTANRSVLHFEDCASLLPVNPFQIGHGLRLAKHGHADDDVKGQLGGLPPDVRPRIIPCCSIRGESLADDRLART